MSDRLSKMDDAEPCRMRDGIGAADGIKLVEKRANMELGSMNRYVEPPGDGLVRGPFGEQGQNLQLAGSQDGVFVGLRHCRRGSHESLRRLAWSDQPKTLHARQQRHQPIGECRIGDIDREPNGPDRSVFGQVMGLSPIVSETCRLSPARRSPSVTCRPRLSAPSACSTDRRWWIGSPFQVIMMSPW